ncbi:asparagine synthase-related protein [Alphaproteobacteria bacterium]|nr:asparagine synthase-related protein [Alphaproteobacteria bacterium]
MIGVFGHWSKSKVAESEANRSAGSFMSSLDHSKYRAKIKNTSHGAVGICQHTRAPTGGISTDASLRLTVAVIGEIFNQNEVASSCNIDPPKNFSDLLLGIYKNGGLNHLDKINGLFCAFIADEREQAVHLITDRYASFPIHCYNGAKGFIFGTSIYTMLKEGSIPRRACEIGVAQLFSLQRTVGSYTNISNVKPLPSGSITTLSRNGVSSKKYWHLRWNDQKLSDNEAAERLAAALTAAVDIQSTKGTANPGLLLSGGVDSRLILGCANNNTLSCWTVASYRQNPEMAIAATAANLCDSKFHPIVVNPESILDWQDITTIENNALYPASTQFSCFVGAAAKTCDTLLTGHGLDYTLRGYYLPAKFLEIFGSKTRLPTLRQLSDEINGQIILDNLRQGPSKSTINRIVKSKKLESWWHGIEGSIDNALQPWIASQEPINAWDAFILSQVSQHYAFTSMMALRAVSNARIPAFDNQLFDLYLGMSPQQRIRGTAVYKALKLISRDLAELENANTGFAASMGSWNEILAQLSRAALRKTRVVKRHVLPSPKHSAGSWQNLGNLFKDDPAHRKRLIDIKERIDTVSFGLLDHDEIVRCIDDHLSGEEQNTKLLRQLLTFDSWVQSYKIY